MVGRMMTRIHLHAFSENGTALAVASRAFVSPGTLVFLGLAR
jgi:hypothetical protein